MANRIVSLKDYELYLLKFRYHFYLLLSEGMRMPWCVGGGRTERTEQLPSISFIPPMWVPRIEFRSPGLVARGFSPAESSSSLYFYYPDVVGPNHTSHVLIASTFHFLCWKMSNRILLSSLCGLPHSSPFCFQAFIRIFFFFDKLKV